MEWKAKWIWNNGEAQPRNYWLCFRKTFHIKTPAESAALHITADSRYILYLNGHRLGMGPVRGWPFEQFYDTYDVADFLKDGENVVAVLVTHYGTSNFQYIEGRAGLFAQIEVSAGSIRKIITSDASWKIRMHQGYARNSVRIDCQQPWAEIYNAGLFDEHWINNGFDDSSWDYAEEIGGPGTLPWTTLKMRDIPFMREEDVYPDRIESARIVKPEGFSASIDLQPYFFPDEKDSNPKIALGYIASVINVPKDTKGRLRLLWGSWDQPFGRFKINDKEYNGPDTEIFLRKGDNFLLLDVSGDTHELFVYFNLQLDVPFKFMLPGNSGLQFAAIGPFESNTIINIGIPRDNSVNMENPDYHGVWACSSWNELSGYNEWIKPVSHEHMCEDNVYAASLCKERIGKLDITADHQNMIIPNQAYSVIQPEKKGDQEFVLDFGREISGYIEFDIDAGAGTIVDFYGFEYMSPERGMEHSEGMNCTLRYIAHEGRQTHFSVIRRGFRFLAVTFRNMSRPVRVYRIFTHMNTYPVVNAGKFECSDWKLNKIWDISRHTTRLCMEDTFVDCPAYEQAFWVGDSRNESLINYYCFGGYDMAKRCLKLVTGSLKRSPLPESQVPSGWQNVLTAWALFWVNACREYYFYTRDEAYLHEIYPSLQKTAHGFLERLNSGGLLELQAWNMLEWAPMDTPSDGIVTHLNVELVKALRDIAWIARKLGLDDEAVILENKADNIKEAVNANLWDESRQAFIDCIHKNGDRSKVISMQTNVMAYLCDCVDGDRKKILEEYLLDTPKDFVHIGSPFMSFFYFEALTKINAVDMIVGNILEQWGRMIDKGASTCWESFEGRYSDKLTRSHCHAWSAAPGYFLGAYVLGVRPLAPGFEKVLIDPAPCGLQWARGSVPVPGGRIDVVWEKHDGAVEVWVNGPKNIEYVYGEGLRVIND